MSNGLVCFDDVRRRVVDVLKTEALPDTVRPLYLVRNLFGKVRLSVPDALEADDSCRDVLRGLSGRLAEMLGAHGYSLEDAVLFVNDELLKTLDENARTLEGLDRIFWVDRLVTGGDWWSVGDPSTERKVARFTLFSVKGGVGRSTTAAVLAWHLASKGERVLVVDLDLESPGLSSAMVGARSMPKFGVVDWFVEDLVGQGDQIIHDMTAAPLWAQSLDGQARVVPAHGTDPGEYLAKLGRVYMDRQGVPWSVRLKTLLERLESELQPSVVLLESRNGLHDIAAATVTHLDAEVFLFAVDSESTWTDYRILFRHWQLQNLATRIRERLSIVSALTPESTTEQYLTGFRQKAWDLFRDHLYDEVSPYGDSGNEFSFDLHEEHAPHDPSVVYWTSGFAAGTSLRDLERTRVYLAYAEFLNRFDELIAGNRGGEVT